MSVRQHRWTSRVNLVILGDVLIFILFSYLGKLQHQLDSSLFPVLYTAFPFLVTWLLVVLFITKLDHDKLTQIRYIIVNTSATWIVAGPLGLLLRTIMEGRLTNLTFIIVTLGTVYLFLLACRILFYIGLLQVQKYFRR